jgi:3-dehydroquinate synthase
VTSPQPILDRTDELVRVDLGARSYDIVIGEDLLARAGADLASGLGRPQVGIVTDETVASLYLGRLEAALDGAGIAHGAVVLPAGEGTKDFVHLDRLCQRLITLRLERSSTLIALGGGVIGDLTGFAAGILLRGMTFIQIPTTLLAQVDSSVGGKTGINLPQGKNLVGLFHQPKRVLIDVSTLDTLDGRQLRAGYAEVVKYGLLGDGSFFAWLERYGRSLLSGDRAARRHAIAVSCRAKARIVEADEREEGLRALLNLGHTFGHALEAETGYSDHLLHGEAVSIGMVLAFELSHRLGYCPAEDRDRVKDHLVRCGLPVALPRDALPDGVPGWRADRLLDHMRRDKKVQGGKLTFVLVRGIGQAFVSRSVPEDAVVTLLEDWIGE